MLGGYMVTSVTVTIFSVMQRRNKHNGAVKCV